MSDVTYSVAFGGLSFDQTSAIYRLVAAEPAEVTYRRTLVTAPFVAGDTMLAEVQDVSAYRVTIRCIGGGSNAGTLVNAIKAAGEATTSLAITQAGASETYIARKPGIQVRGEFEDLYNNQRLVTLTFPTQPFPS